MPFVRSGILPYHPSFVSYFIYHLSYLTYLYWNPQFIATNVFIHLMGTAISIILVYLFGLPQSSQSHEFGLRPLIEDNRNLYNEQMSLSAYQLQTALYRRIPNLHKLLANPEDSYIITLKPTDTTAIPYLSASSVIATSNSAHQLSGRQSLTSRPLTSRHSRIVSPYSLVRPGSRRSKLPSIVLRKDGNVFQQQSENNLGHRSPRRGSSLLSVLNENSVESSNQHGTSTSQTDLRNYSVALSAKRQTLGSITSVHPCRSRSSLKSILKKHTSFSSNYYMPPSKAVGSPSLSEFGRRLDSLYDKYFHFDFCFDNEDELVTNNAYTECLSREQSRLKAVARLEHLLGRKKKKMVTHCSLSPLCSQALSVLSDWIPVRRAAAGTAALLSYMPYL